MKHRRKKNKRCYLGVLLILVGLTGVSYFGIGHLRRMNAYRDSRQYYEKLSEDAEAEDTVESGEEAGDIPELRRVDFAYLSSRAAKGTVTAWLYAPGTPIDYPVVLSEDPYFYLDHLLDGTPNAGGCLFFDGRSRGDFTERNTVIYGHSMYDGSMFAYLLRYQQQAYYEEHPSLYLLTPQGNYELQVCAVLLAEPESTPDPWQVYFEEEQDGLAWLLDMRDASLIQTQGTIPVDAKCVTLATCAYGKKGSRMVIVTIMRPLGN